MIRFDSVRRIPQQRIRVLLNGREVNRAVAVGALWNGGPGVIEVATRIAGRLVDDETRQRAHTYNRFGLVRVEPIE